MALLQSKKMQNLSTAFCEVSLLVSHIALLLPFPLCVSCFDESHALTRRKPVTMLRRGVFRNAIYPQDIFHKEYKLNVNI